MKDRSLHFVGFILACFGFAAHANTYTVGSGAGCTHGTIQSAINAADSHFGYDEIRLTRSLTYEPESNTVNTSDDLSIVGGYATCTQSTSDGVYTVVSGFGAANGTSVFNINTSGTAIVTLRLLQITAARQYGINFHGSGTLQLIENTIDRNKVGGIHAEASPGSSANLAIYTGNVILQNGTTGLGSGGGVSLTGAVTMTMVATKTTIGLNTAQLGGGLYVGSGATANIGSPGYGGLAVIDGNDATLGGGIFVAGTLNLYTTDPTHPVRVAGNWTDNSGGGIYVSGADALLCARDFVIEDNQAGITGGAIVAANGSYGYSPNVLLNVDSPDCVVPAMAKRCASSTTCNRISGNSSDHNDSYDPSGAIIAALSYAFLRADHVTMRDNTGEYMVYGNDSNISLDHMLIADNTISGTVLVSSGSATAIQALALGSSTIANNDFTGYFVLHSPWMLFLTNDIIDQPGVPTYVTIPHQLYLHNLLLSSTANIPPAPDIIVDSPMFIDAAHGNYHLNRYSQAVDFAEADTYDPLDLDGKPYDVDLPRANNRYGPRDLGAFELQSEDCGIFGTIFCTSFE
ncbi:MAG TPA: hypothetical protein VFN29_00695 [Chiayiivirga sp.]|nr:hypothetical protein [Chiayiivirga sp.]